MAELDKLIAAMAQRSATRAILTADQATKITVNEQDIAGSVVPAAKVQSMLAEVLSFEDYERLFHDGQFQVVYNSPSGPMTLSIWRAGGTLGATIEPASGGVTPPAPTHSSAAPPIQGQVMPVKHMDAYQGGNSSLPLGMLDVDFTNTSGMGAMASLPAELQGWNWGAFLANWIWGVGNNVWLALICWLPCAGLVMPFVLGSKGNEWAWQNKRYESIAQFKQIQKTWAIVGVALLFFQFLACTPLLILPGLSMLGASIRSGSQVRESRLESLASAVNAYADANGGAYPPYSNYDSWKTAVLPYVAGQDEKVFVSPGDSKPYRFNTRLANQPKTNVSSTSRFPLVWEDPTSSYHTMAFTDGSVKTFNDKEWPRWLDYASTAPLPSAVP